MFLVLIQSLILFLLKLLQVFAVDFNGKRISPIGFMWGLARRLNKISITGLKDLFHYKHLFHLNKVKSLNAFLFIVMARYLQKTSQGNNIQNLAGY